MMSVSKLRNQVIAKIRRDFSKIYKKVVQSKGNNLKVSEGKIYPLRGKNKNSKKKFKWLKPNQKECFSSLRWGNSPPICWTFWKSLHLKIQIAIFRKMWKATFERVLIWTKQKRKHTTMRGGKFIKAIYAIFVWYSQSLGKGITAKMENVKVIMIYAKNALDKIPTLIEWKKLIIVSYGKQFLTYLHLNYSGHWNEFAFISNIVLFISPHLFFDIILKKDWNIFINLLTSQRPWCS